MAYSYPYFYSPTRRYPNYNYRYPDYYGKTYNPSTKEVVKGAEHKKEKESRISSNVESEEDRICKEESRECFEIFGIKLFFDDILLICLIFFLYNEGVKDQYLFISLILLLLS